MTDYFKDESFEEQPAVLESEMKASLKATGRNKSPWADGISMELFQDTKTESIKILTKICQQIWETKQWPASWKH